MIWLAWLSRNQTIFQGFDFTPPHVAHITRSACNKNRPSSKENPVKELKESEKPDFGIGLGYFDGGMPRCPRDVWGWSNFISESTTHN